MIDCKKFMSAARMSVPFFRESNDPLGGVFKKVEAYLESVKCGNESNLCQLR